MGTLRQVCRGRQCIAASCTAVVRGFTFGALQDPVSKDGSNSMDTQTQGALPCAQGYPQRHQTGSPLPPAYGYPAPPPAPALQNGVHSGFAAFDSPAAVAAARPALGGGSLF